MDKERMGRKEGGREDGELERRRRGGGGRDRRDKEGGGEVRR